MPLTTLQNITRSDSTVSLIEFSLKNPDINNKALTNITQSLPNNVKITKVQQVAQFAQAVNDQTVNFINIWSIAIYAVVIAASYVIATRIINEAKYELYMLRSLGTKKKSTLTLIVTHTVAVVFVGSVVGLALGIVGTQMASTGIRWVWDNSLLAPFLQPIQAVEILLLALASSLIGTIYPAIQATRSMEKEQPT
jgi:ABC-type lipoprotein release transport system permease subunit